MMQILCIDFINNRVISFKLALCVSDTLPHLVPPLSVSPLRYSGRVTPSVAFGDSSLNEGAYSLPH